MKINRKSWKINENIKFYRKSTKSKKYTKIDTEIKKKSLFSLTAAVREYDISWKALQPREHYKSAAKM